MSEEASAIIEDPTEYQWDDNKHEAKHKQEYMDHLQGQVGTFLATTQTTVAIVAAVFGY